MRVEKTVSGMPYTGVQTKNLHIGHVALWLLCIRIAIQVRAHPRCKQCWHGNRVTRLSSVNSSKHMEHTVSVSPNAELVPATHSSHGNHCKISVPVLIRRRSVGLYMTRPSDNSAEVTVPYRSSALSSEYSASSPSSVVSILSLVAIVAMVAIVAIVAIVRVIASSCPATGVRRICAQSLDVDVQLWDSDTCSKIERRLISVEISITTPPRFLYETVRCGVDDASTLIPACSYAGKSHPWSRCVLSCSRHPVVGGSARTAQE